MRNLWGWSLLDDITIYSVLGLSTMHLVISAVAGSANTSETSKAYFAAILTLWIFYVYAMADSMPLYKLGSQYAPTNTTKICCPNSDIQTTYRKLLFGGSQYFLLPSAVTASYLTIQMLVAGAGVAYRETSAWPGISGILYTGCLMCTFLQLHFGGILTRVCPDAMFRLVLIDHPVIGYSYIIAGSWFGMLLCMGLESMSLAKPIQIAVGFLQCANMIVFTGSVGFAAYYRGMLTLGLMGMLAHLSIPCIINFFALWFIPSEKKESQASAPMLEALAPQRSQKRTTRWVLPIQTTSARMHILEKKGV